MRHFLALIAFAYLLGTACHSNAETTSIEQPVGFRALEVPGISTVVWYPTDSSSPVKVVGGNAAFVGVPVVENAPLSSGKYPVVVLSHGYSGMWRNQAWLAARLTRLGFISVSLNHPGTTFGDIDPLWAAHVGTRPQQVSRVLDALLADSVFMSSINQRRIAVVGHSQGAATALLLAGAVFEPDRFLKACGDNETIIVCDLYRTSGLTAGMADVSVRDPRISAVVMLGMEGIRGFAPESLSQLPVPVLALVAGIETRALPLGWEGRAEAALLPSTHSRYAEIVGATHFSFMSICVPDAEKLLEAEAYVCTGETVDRPVLHQQIALQISHFLGPNAALAVTSHSP